MSTNIKKEKGVSGRRYSDNIYPCPCTEEGVKCNETFRYRFCLRAHILKEHEFTPEGKILLEERRARSKKNYQYSKERKKKNV
jgi:hypothetical protein